jgi:hypothetical protein
VSARTITLKAKLESLERISEALVRQNENERNHYSAESVKATLRNLAIDRVEILRELCKLEGDEK